MGLSNGQYDRIQREYSRRIAADREEQQEHIREAFERIPELKAMEETTADLSMQRARDLLAGRTEAAGRAARQLKELKEEKAVLLASGGYPADYLELHYVCPACRDTGYVDGQKCSCMKKLIVSMIYDQSSLREVLQRENFSTFSFDFFDKNTKDTGTGLSSYDTMKKNVDISREFIRNLDTAPGNLLLMGQAGTGKTFLSNCIAKELMDTYHSVIYLSSSQLFDELAKQAFSRDEETGYTESGRYILDCDLLIIDDLGTELNNAFVGSRLFHVINERIIRRKATIISTNLTMNDVRTMYTERVASRIIGSYQILRFPDQDIRLMKKLRGIGNAQA